MECDVMDIVIYNINPQHMTQLYLNTLWNVT